MSQDSIKFVKLHLQYLKDPLVNYGLYEGKSSLPVSEIAIVVGGHLATQVQFGGRVFGRGLVVLSTRHRRVGSVLHARQPCSLASMHQLPAQEL
jgi:hypothetical protein